MLAEQSGDFYDYTKTMQPERPWLLPYHQSLVYKVMNCTKGADGKADEILMTFEETLDAIRKIDNLTCGMPQVLYLTGWQYEGHDSKYPAWHEGNRHLMRQQDETALDSLRWLMREAGERYGASASLHINMFDAYPDSPLWNEYVDKDIIAKDKDGKVIPGKEWSGVVSYQISYTQEWQSSLARKRIDELIALIPELKDSKTIHIDAFLGERPLGRGEPISPYLGYSKEEEAATQRKIYRYWRDNGIDVTSEWAYGLRDDRCVGLQPWAWHQGDKLADLPDSLYCTNVMDEGRELRGDPAGIPAYKAEFYLKVMPWYYKNNPQGIADPQGMLDGTDICMPALWIDDKSIIAYSQTGYEGKAWQLPPAWRDVPQVALERITWEGLEPAGAAEVVDGRLNLSLAADEALKITVSA